MTLTGVTAYLHNEYGRHDQVYQHIPNQERDQKIGAIMSCEVGESLYKAFYKDYDCFNPYAKSIRACAAASALMGDLKNTRMDLPDGEASQRDVQIFYRIRNEMIQKLKRHPFKNL